MHHLKTV